MARLKPWILVDPVHKHPDTGDPLFRDPDGDATPKPDEAEEFNDKEEAEKAAEGEPEGWVPRPLDDDWPRSRQERPSGEPTATRTCPR